MIKPEQFRDFLRILVPQRMADDLAAAGNGGELEFVAEQVKEYLEAGEPQRREMASFHEGDGLGMIRTAIMTTEANMSANDPTAEELRRAAGLQPPQA